MGASMGGGGFGGYGGGFGGYGGGFGGYGKTYGGGYGGFSEPYGGTMAYSSAPTPTPTPTLTSTPASLTAQDRFATAGGGFLGRGTQPAGEGSFDRNWYSSQYGDAMKASGYSDPYKHYTEVGLAKGMLPYETATAAPSTQAKYKSGYFGVSDPSLVTQGYQSLLRRAPTPYEQAFWTQETQRGLTGQGLVGAGLMNPEFQRRQEYGRAYTEAFRPGYQEFGPSGQYYQPIYQQQYTNYSRSPTYYQPSYGMSLMSPQSSGYGFGSFNPFAYYAEGGEVAEDEGIAALRDE